MVPKANSMRGFPSPGLRLLGDKRGVTALEYGMMAALIAMVVFGAVTQLGTKALSLWTTVSTLRF